MTEPSRIAPDKVDICIAWQIEREIVAQMTNLRWIQSTGAGVDQLNPHLIPRHIALTRVGPNVGLQQRIAEYVLAYTLMFTKRIHEYQKLQTDCQWTKLKNRLLTSLRMAILGTGNTGGAIAQCLIRNGIKVTGVRRSAKGKRPSGMKTIDFNRLMSEIGSFDGVVLALPLTDATRGMINSHFLAKMRKGAFLINVARGPIIVEQDLIESVETHWLSGAVLDVFDEEPLRRDHPYWSCPGIYMTPHISGDTNIKEAVDEFCENLSRFRAGQPLNLLVDKERGF